MSSFVGLPEQIFKLPAIETVDASDNKIMAWPKKMDKLTKKAKVNTEGKRWIISVLMQNYGMQSSR